jgi:hypothetical protein
LSDFQPITSSGRTLLRRRTRTLRIANQTSFPPIGARMLFGHRFMQMLESKAFSDKTAVGAPADFIFFLY